MRQRLYLLFWITCLCPPSFGYTKPQAQRVTDQGTLALYVSAKGNDLHDGTKQAPLKSLEGARNRVRLLRKGNPDQGVVVYIRGGLYPLEKPVVFGAEDSGTERSAVTYQAAAGEQPVFSGGRRLSHWKKVKDKQALARLAGAAIGKVYVTDLKAAGISDFGDPTELERRPELFCNQQLQTLARWPNAGLAKAGQAMGQTPLPETYIARRGFKEGDFEYLDNRQGRWALESDARLGGYWYWDWSEEFEKVARVDTLKKTIQISPPYHGYGYKDSLHYFGLNLFCEIDSQGEWYLDRTAGLLYWYPPTGVNPSRAEVNLSAFAAPYMVRVEDCSHFSLKGLAFEEGRGSAISVQGGQHCLISDCRIERFGQDGIHVKGGSATGISGCMLATFGCGGIKMEGGDRKKLISSGHFIENTVVQDFSLFKTTYQPAVFMEGCGHRISHNRFSNSSSSAFRLEGNDMVIEYNQISRVVNESDDQGGLDVFYNPSYQGNIVRYNHWSDISGGTLHGAAGVRLDDMISGFLIYGNVFERCGARHFGAVQIHGGKDNMIRNNLFFNCPSAASFSTWENKRWYAALQSPSIRQKLYEEVDINSAIYQEKYPLLKNIRLNPNVNSIVDNLLVDCPQVLRNGQEQVSRNNTSVASAGKSIETFCDTAFLKTIGLQPIPFRDMGPKQNRWETKK